MMADTIGPFPLGKGVSETAAWLEKGKFGQVFGGWEADAIAGKSQEYILEVVPGELGERLLGFIDRAKEEEKAAVILAARASAGSAAGPVRKRLRTLSVSEAYATDRVFKNKMAIAPIAMPRNAEDVRQILEAPCSCRLPMDAVAAGNLAEEGPRWKAFVEECVEPTSDEGCCFLEALTRSLIATTPRNVSYSSEVEMTIDLDMSFALLEYIVSNGTRHRNTASTTTGSKRPNYVAAQSWNIPVLQGEDMLMSNYTPGVSGHDPELQNKEKTPWDAWDEFYGDAALFLGYAAIGDVQELTVKLGCLVKQTQSFDVVKVLNLHNEGDRVDLLQAWVKLVPVLKGIMDAIKRRAHRSTQLVIDHNRRVGGYIVLEMRKAVLGVMGRATFVKSWQFFDGADAAGFYHRLRTILDTLHGAEGFLREHSSAPTDKLHISFDQQHTVVCVFAPYCRALPITFTADMIQGWMLQLCDRVEHLHSHSIVHNDIRPQNVMLSAHVAPDGPLPVLYLIDYDECVVISDGNPAPGRRFNVDDHAPNISLSHGMEVDIWGVCHIFSKWAETMNDSEAAVKVRWMEAGAQLKASYKTTTLDHIRDAIRTGR